ncbi:hypothetical protein AQI88_38870 [Streptomyces cellostaticus]|uniref:Uncharacterized protein n=1 Tax=Streptomyces cellostaticus TaxID=67285 RepID=A0A101NBS8_9ACTN|nr:hypothetical protein AQI88_38870 [Streptomyces cellostaticus]
MEGTPSADVELLSTTMDSTAPPLEALSAVGIFIEARWPGRKALATGPGSPWHSIGAIVRATAAYCLPFSSTSASRRGRRLPQS